MKKLTLFLCSMAALSALLFGCGKSTVEAEPDTLPFPGTQWGMTPEDVWEALKLTEGSYTEEVPEENGYLTYREAYLEVFGANACVGFQFSDDNADGTYSLCRVVVTYPRDADMQAVQKAMEAVYGRPTDAMEGKSAEWSSAALCWDYMTEQDREYLKGKGSAGEEPMQAPLTTIQLMTYYPFAAAYREEPSTNVVTLQSSYAFYVSEGGYTGA